MVLVGGGSILVPPSATLAGSSETIRPKHAEVANAIGSALCQVSGTVDVVEAIDPNIAEAGEVALEKAKQSATEAAVASGAIRNTVDVGIL